MLESIAPIILEALRKQSRLISFKFENSFNEKIFMILKKFQHIFDFKDMKDEI